MPWRTAWSDVPFRVRPVLLDIEELNRRAHTGEFDLTKLSVGAFAGVGDRYRLLRSGAALGRGVGPLVVSRSPMTLTEAVNLRMAIPGRETTAYRLLRLAAASAGPGGSSGAPSGMASSPAASSASAGGVVEMRYDRILHAIADGTVDAGLIIHESRFTYADHELALVVDLGEWWERHTGLPVPLAGICARADMDDACRAAAERAIRDSVQYAFDNPEASREYVRAHAQEMSDAGVRETHRALRQRAQPRHRRRGNAGHREAGSRLMAGAAPRAARRGTHIEAPRHQASDIRHQT